jgi:hypothetical protein
LDQPHAGRNTPTTSAVRQVEEEVTHEDADLDRGPVVRTWRDARVEDLAELGLSSLA